MTTKTKFDLYPGKTKTITIGTGDGVEETARQVREWVTGYGYKPAQIPDMESGIWQRVINNKRRAFDQLTELGIRRDHIKHSIAECILPGGTFSVRLSARLDWPRGDFGDDSSCLYGSYSSNLDAMRHYGTLVLQFFDQFGVGVGRLWLGVYPPQAIDLSLSIVEENREDSAYGILVFGGYGRAYNFQNHTGHRPSPILGALILSQLAGTKLKLSTEGGLDGGVWLGGKPVNNIRTTYARYEGMERQRSGRCTNCNMDVHALDSRWPTPSLNNVGILEFQCMECLLDSKFNGEFVECPV